MNEAWTYLSMLRGEVWFYVAFGAYALGIVLGLTRTITVYSSYADVFRCFAAISIPILTAAIHDRLDSTLIYLLLGLSVASLLWVLVTTFRDNRNPIAALLAFIVKVPTGALFVFLMLDIVAPSGNGSERRRTRQRSMLDFLLLGLLVKALIIPRGPGDATMPMGIGRRMPRARM